VVVTSRSGAALRDVLTVTRRRAACVDVILSPATVQGEGAVETLLLALERALQVRGAEVVLLVRGGGSLEDLMPFNDERLARAIRASRLPVVVGVGHETDTTIADLAADRRAPTPSAAAELVVPNCARLGDELLARRFRLGQAARQEVAVKRGAAERSLLRLANVSPQRRLPGYRQELDGRAARLRAALGAAASAKRRRLDAGISRLQMSSPGQRLALQRAELAGRSQRLRGLVSAGMRERRDRLTGQGGRLEALSPLRTLERGYSISMDAVSGAVLETTEGIEPGRRVRTRLARGTMISSVQAVEGEPSGVDKEKRTDVR
jgi:exodeoxyribonuclease VII large subunit